MDIRDTESVFELLEMFCDCCQTTVK